MMSKFIKILVKNNKKNTYSIMENGFKTIEIMNNIIKI